MNDAQFAAYGQYVRDLADRLLLRDWEIDLDRDSAVPDSWACVNVLDTENYAMVRVQWPHFFGKPPEEQREILTHELIHLHLDRPNRVMGQLAEQVSGGACEFARDAHRKEIEIVVQRFARLLAPGLPLPPEVAE